MCVSLQDAPALLNGGGGPFDGTVMIVMFSFSTTLVYGRVRYLGCFWWAEKLRCTHDHPGPPQSLPHCLLFRAGRACWGANRPYIAHTHLRLGSGGCLQSYFIHNSGSREVYSLSFGQTDCAQLDKQTDTQSVLLVCC